MKNWKIIIILCGMVLAVMVVTSWPSQKTKLVFCDVGQGDGVMLIKGNFQMLYDTGPDNGKMRKCVERRVPFWDRKLEIVVISHWDKDHSGGLGGISRGYKIEKLYSGSKDNEQKFYPEILRAKDIIRSDWFEFEVVWPGESSQARNQPGKPDDVKEMDNNEMSLVGVLEVGNKRVLLTGDASVEVEQRLVWRKILTGSIDILKVGHHGSKTSTSEELLETIKPKIAVIGVGKNSYGHPDRGVLERLMKFGVEVKRTDRDGTVVFEL